MAGFTMTTRVEAPVQRVFEAFSDVANAADRIEGIKRVEIMTPGPIRVGTSFKETRQMFGKDATETMTFTAFEPNRMYAIDAISCGTRMRSTFRFVPDGNATNVEYTLDVKALSLHAKLFAPLSFLMNGMIRKCVQNDINDLKRFCETEIPSSAH